MVETKTFLLNDIKCKSCFETKKNNQTSQGNLYWLPMAQNWKMSFKIGNIQKSKFEDNVVPLQFKLNILKQGLLAHGQFWKFFDKNIHFEAILKNLPRSKKFMILEKFTKCFFFFDPENNEFTPNTICISYECTRISLK